MSTMWFELAVLGKTLEKFMVAVYLPFKYCIYILHNEKEKDARHLLSNN